MFSPSADPHRVKAIEIRDVERVEDAPMIGGECQLLVVRLLDETSVQSRNHCDPTRPESGDKIAVHRVLVDVDLDLAHR
jgi:hypothetical protein